MATNPVLQKYWKEHCALKRKIRIPKRLWKKKMMLGWQTCKTKQKKQAP